MRLAALLLLAVAGCSACDCTESTVQFKRDHAEIIFRGIIVELRDSSKPTDASWVGRDTKKVVVFKVSRVWKGHVGETFKMPGIEETSGCWGFWPSLLKVGQDLLVYASRVGGSDYLTSICGNHKSAKYSEKEFKTLGLGKEPDRPPQPTK